MAGTNVSALNDKGKTANPTGKVHLTNRAIHQIDDMLAEAYAPIKYLGHMLAEVEVKSTPPKFEAWMAGEILEALDGTCREKFLELLQERGVEMEREGGGHE